MISRHQWMPWASLIRLPNVFTCPGDVLAGYCLASSASFGDARSLSAAIASSCSIYFAGMVWNDVFDFEVDRRERPHRPLASGAISIQKGTVTGSILLLIGIAAGWMAGPSTGMGAIALSGLVLTYDGLVKNGPLAPVVMGLCRGMNLLTGAWSAGNSTLPWLNSTITIAAMAHVIYITGVTAFARHEARERQNPILLAAGIALVYLGLAMHLVNSFRHGQVDIVGGLLFAGLAGHLSAMFFLAWIKPSPMSIQSAVKSSVLGLIALDAALLACFGAGMVALAVLSLLIPALFLGRWLYST